MTENFICTTQCVQCPACSSPPVNAWFAKMGQTWNTLSEMQERYQNDLYQVELNLYKIQTQPKFAFGRS